MGHAGLLPSSTLHLGALGAKEGVSLGSDIALVRFFGEDDFSHLNSFVMLGGACMHLLNMSIGDIMDGQIAIDPIMPSHQSSMYFEVGSDV